MCRGFSVLLLKFAVLFLPQQFQLCNRAFIGYWIVGDSFEDQLVYDQTIAANFLKFEIIDVDQ